VYARLVSQVASLQAPPLLLCTQTGYPHSTEAGASAIDQYDSTSRREPERLPIPKPRPAASGNEPHADSLLLGKEQRVKNVCQAILIGEDVQLWFSVSAQSLWVHRTRTQGVVVLLYCTHFRCHGERFLGTEIVTAVLKCNRPQRRNHPS